MGIGFNEAAFTAGFNQSATGVREAIKAKRDADSAMNVARAKAVSDAKLKQEERDYKEEVRLKQAFSDNYKQFQAIAPKNVKLASMGYNSTNKENGIPDRKYTVDTNGESFTFDGTVDDSEKWKVVQADLSAYKGEGLYRVSKTGILESRQNDASEFTPTDTRGMSSRMFREMDSDSQLTKTKMIQVEIDGRIIEKTRDWYDSIPDKDKPKIVETEKGKSKASGYDTKLMDTMSSEEINKFEEQGIDPNTVSRQTLQYLRKTNIAGTKKTDFDKKIEFIQESSEIMNEIYSGEKDINNISKKDIGKLSTAEKISGFKGLGETQKKTIIDSEQTISSGKRLKEFLDDIGEEEIDRGAYDSIKSFGKRMLSDTTWNKLSPEEKQKSLLTIATNTKIGNALAQYIKSISGTAVAQAEYDRLRSVFTTGDLSNIQSVKQAVGTFYEDLQDAHYGRLKDNMLEGGSFVLSKMKTHKSRFKKKTRTGKTKDGKTVVQYSDGSISYGD